MPSTRDIRRRIRGVKNIKQVTRAMNMIAAARLRRAQTKAESARPYAERLREILQDVQASGVGGRHPLLARREVKKIGVLLVTSDRGLAGAFNATIIRETDHFLREQTTEVGLVTVGKKGRDHFRARGVEIDQHFVQPSRDVRLEELGAISKRIIADYSNGRYDRVYLAFSEFKSVLKSVASVIQLLPIEEKVNGHAATGHTATYQFEPESEELLNTLLPQYVEVLIYRALVESLASEQAARMIAMKAATDSATDMIESLTREYNRVRQTSITTQILEVVSGAEALKHGGN
ncbi:MAG TPA: ATP synthase F1 subunit gamma [Verrucomicrobiae bacterium]|nr:ATP synthase F1 subunit gamma [Verrucomicrobiae bacterium]